MRQAVSRSWGPGLASLALVLCAEHAGAQTFRVAARFGAGLNPRSVALADFDGDGNQDLVTANTGANTVSVLLGDGAGGYGPATNHVVGSFPRDIAIADLDGDSNADLVVANSGSGDVSVLLGDGAGGFAAAVTFAAGGGPSALVVEDLDGDGEADLAVANGNSDNVSVLLGDGAGGFSAPANFGAGNTPRGIASADFNSDTVPDLVVANNGSNDVSLLLGDGSGGFGAAASFGTGINPNALAAGDLDGDSKADILVSNFGSNDVSVRLGDGAGGFGPRVNYAAGIGPRTIVLGDWNGDGKKDFAVASSGSNTVGVRLGTAGGAFGGLRSYGAGNDPVGLAAGSVDGDAIADLVVANATSSDVSILIGLAAGAFSAAQAFDVGTTPSSAEAADFNEDGRVDLAVANADSNTVSILLGAGTGGFTPATSHPAGTAPASVAVGDFNADNNLDLAVANNQSDDVSILLGDGAGGFAAAVSHPAGTDPSAVAVADLNGDAHSDLVVANSGSNDVSVLLGDGAGGFGAAASYGAGQQPASVVIGLLNADAHPDLAVANLASDNISILLGDGSGGFGNDVTVPASLGPRSLALGDFNKDGNADLAVAMMTTNRVLVLRGDGAGNFALPLYFATRLSPRGVAVGDFNGDSSLDLALAAHDSEELSLLNGNGTGVFASAIHFAAGSGPTALVVADLDGDGKSDLSVVNATSSSVWTLLNTTNFLRADLAITKDDGQTETAPGAPISYDITVTNNGPHTLTSLTVIDTLPPELLSPVFTPDTGSYDSGTGEWTGLSLASGQSATLTLDATVDPDAVGSVTNTVTVTPPIGVGDPVAGNNTDTDVDILHGLSIDDQVALESGGTATFTVSLSQTSSQTITVNYATRNGTASAGSDYVAASGQLSFAPGTLSQPVPVTILQDALSELNESFFVDLSGAAGAAIIDGEGQGTIVDDDPLPSLAIADAALAEGNSGTQNLLLTVTLSTPSGQPVSVDYATSDGTASAPSDYTASSGTLVIPAGAPSGQIAVPIKGDVINENNETFLVDLSNPRAVTIADGQGVGTILNDDGPPELSVDDVQVVELSGGSVAAFTVSLSAPSGLQVTVAYASADGTALAGSDYTAVSDTLTFAPGTTTQVVAVPILGDATLESTEDYYLNLSNPTGATIGKGRGQGWILDQGAGQRLQFSAAVYSVKEGTAQANVLVKRIGGTSGTVSVDYEASDGSAVAGQDYTAVSGTLTFPPKVSSRSFKIPITNDTIVDAGETILLSLKNAMGGPALGAPSAATLAIQDNDAGGLLALSAAKYSVGEAGPSLTLTVKRTKGAAGGVSVQIATSDGTASDGVDYTGIATTLSFAAGQASQTVTIPILEDALFEGNETFGVALSNPTGGAALGKIDAAVVTIVENEPSLQFGAISYTVSETKQVVSVTVTRSGSTAGTVGISYASADGTATAGQDYTAVAGTLSFGPKIAQRTFTVPLLSDAIQEGNETFLLSLSNPTGGAGLGEPSTATVTITENDVGGEIYFSAAAYAKSETAGTVTITVKRKNGSASGASVDYATSDGTAQQGVDYVFSSGTLVFAAGQTSATFSVTILDNLAVEPDETVNLTLSNPGGGATLGSPAAAVLTILTDNPVLQFSMDSYSVGEQGPVATITVVRSGPSAAPVSVDYETSDGSASAPGDYTATSGTLSFGSKVTKRTFTVPIVDDPIVEGDETVNLALSNPLGGAALGAQSAALLTISTDNPALQFSVSAYTVAESKGKMTITVTRSAPKSGAVTVAYATSNGTATAGDDYSAAAGTLTFKAGVVKQTFTVSINNDTLVEGSETVNLTLSSPGGDAILGARSTAVLTITSEDKGGTLQLSAATYSASEAGPTATITVKRTGGSASDVTVDFDASPGTAVPGTHFLPVSGTLVFASGELTKTFTVLILDDQVASGNKTVNLTIGNAGGGGTLGSQTAAVLWILDCQ